MKGLSMVGAALAAGLIGAPTMAAPSGGSSIQPPMDGFNDAFYTCDNGRAFLIAYDSETPANATMTTNDNDRRYALKRTPADTGVQFTGEAAKFWTDGKSVVVEGTDARYRNCKLKSG